MLRIVGLVALMGLATVQAADRITEVKHMLEDMKKEAEDEQAAKAKGFADLKCMKEKTIEDNDAEADEQETILADAKADEGAQTSCAEDNAQEAEVQQGNFEKYSKNIDDAKESRAKAAQAYTEAQSQRADVIATLGSAVAALKDANAGFLQLAHNRDYGHDLQLNLLHLLATMPLPEAKIQHITNLVQQQGDSGAIFGILKEMKLQNQADSDAAKKGEQIAQKAHDTIVADQTALMKASKKSHIDADALAKKCGAAAIEAGERAATAKQIATKARDVEAKAKTTLNAASKLFGEETEARNAEIKSLNEALMVLNDDDTKALFDRTKGVQFLQVKDILRKTARGTTFVELFSKLNKIRPGVFDKVIEDFQKKKGELQQALKDDVAERDACVSDLNELTQTIADTKNSMNVAESEQADAKEASAAAQREIDENNKKIAASQINTKKAGEERQAQNVEFQKIVNDQRATANVLGKVRAALTKGGGSGSRHRGGVLGKIDSIIEDANRSAKMAINEENMLQADFVDTVADANEQIAEWRKSNSQNLQAKATAEEDKSAAGEEYDGHEDKHLTAHEKNMSRKKDCKPYMDNFEDRIKARKVEMEGIDQAVAILKGADLS